MAKTSYCLVLSLLMVGCINRKDSGLAEKSGQEFTYSANDSLVRGFKVNGKINGILEILDYYNSCCEEVEYKSGIRNGTYKMFLCTKNDKTLRITGFFKNDLRDSTWITYSEKNGVQEVVNYKLGLLNGESYKKLPLLSAQVINLWENGLLKQSKVVFKEKDTVLTYAHGSGYTLDMPFLGEKEYIKYEYAKGRRDGEVHAVTTFGDTTMYGSFVEDSCSGLFTFINLLNSVSVSFVPDSILANYQSCYESNLNPLILEGNFRNGQPIGTWSIYDKDSFLVRAIVVSNTNTYPVLPSKGINRYKGKKAIVLN